MYGLSDAPQIWQKVVKKVLHLMGYKQLVSTSCTYVHPETGVLIVAHVDDFLVYGTESLLRDLLTTSQETYECFLIFPVLK